MTDQDLNRMITAYQTRDPSVWHGDLPADTLAALEELRELRGKVSEVLDVLGPSGG